jgi:hypothetical protein
MNFQFVNKLRDKLNSHDDCKIYSKHHNCIDGIWSCLKPKTWDEVPEIEKYDKEDEDGSLLKMLKDLYVYDVNEMTNFKNPTDEHGIEETIFIIKVNDDYFLCESQGDEYVKFAIRINTLNFIKKYDRKVKLEKILKNIKKP